MNRYFLLIIVVLLFSQISIVSGQDTLHFLQVNSPWVSNNFYFYKSGKTSTEGIFEKKMESDDLQRWYGKGRFKEYKKKIVLEPFQCVRIVCHKKPSQISPDSLIGECSVVDSSLINSLIFLKRGDNLFLKSVRGGKTKFKKI